jgi:hypothetical protein
MQLVLVIPGLLAIPAEALEARRPLRALAAYSGAPRPEPRGIAAALFASLGVASDAPDAPLALLGADGDPGDDYILRADPVHLAADRDTVLLVQHVDDLPQDAAGALVGVLNRHFADDDLHFEALRPDAWFVRREQAADIVTTALDVALGKRLLPHLPRGGDAGRWKRWLNEIEMLLHTHEVNATREAHGASVASGIWFSGGGRLADVPALPATVVVAAPGGRLGDLARGIARRGRGLVAELRADETATQALARAATRSGGHTPFAVAVVPPSRDAERIDDDWLEAALDLLARRDIDALHLVTDGNGAAATWSARPPSMWRRIASRVGRRRFVAPLAIP